ETLRFEVGGEQCPSCAAVGGFVDPRLRTLARAHQEGCSIIYHFEIAEIDIRNAARSHILPGHPAVRGLTDSALIATDPGVLSLRADRPQVGGRSAGDWSPRLRRRRKADHEK